MILLSWLQFGSNYLGPLIGNLLKGPIYATRPIILLKTECCGQNFNYKSTSSDKIPCSKGRCQSSFWSTDPKTLKFCTITDICSRLPGKNNSGNWTQSEWLVLWVCKLVPVHCKSQFHITYSVPARVCTPLGLCTPIGQVTQIVSDSRCYFLLATYCICL